MNITLEAGLRLTHTPSAKPNPILNVVAHIANNGYSNATIEWTDKALHQIQKHVSLDNPEAVKRFIAQKTSQSYKCNLAVAYDRYCKYYEIEWKKPRFQLTSRAVRIPTSEQLEMLIANARQTMSVKLRLSKETGLRPCELCNLKVRDLDLEQRLVYPTTAKRGAPRKLKISSNLSVALQNHVNTKKLQPADKLFKGSSRNYGKYYRAMRNRLAEKLCKPELRTIRLYDFRHYFATMLYAKTRDIVLVKQQMGHKRLETTMIYTQLLNIYDDEWTCRTARNVKESTELIEAGFKYVTDQDGLKLFRKRK